MTTSAVGSLIQQLQQEAKQHHQRRLLVCAGSSDWCLQQTRHVIQPFDGSDILCVGENILPDVNTINAGQSKQWLGHELDCIIYNAHCGFDVDAFGAISGTLRAGGVMLLLTPDLSLWPDFKDPEHTRIQVYPQTTDEVSGYYLQRLTSIIHNTDALWLFSESGQCKKNQWLATEKESPDFIDDICRTEEQATAVAAIHKVARGHRRRPLILTADRGRGKSAALGIASGQLLDEGIERILVTAPTRASAETVFQHAQERTQLEPDLLHQRMIFMAPDELLRSNTTCDVLLVDEAAAIPAPLLEKLLQRFPRIVFASTIHGYEGTGRGFAIRFRKTLDQLTPQRRLLHIHQPIRWQINDPLETFVFEALLLNATPAELENRTPLPSSAYDFRLLTPSELIANNCLLHELFGLLVSGSLSDPAT